MKLRNFFLAAWLTILSLVGFSASAWTSGPTEKDYEGWPRIVGNFSGPTHSKATYRNFIITISKAADQSAGGSGGGIYEVEVKNTKTEKTYTFGGQMIAERVLEIHDGLPQIETWGRGGGGTYSRLLWRADNGVYTTIRDDLFDLNIERAKRKDVTATLPYGQATLYYTGTMYPESP